MAPFSSETPCSPGFLVDLCTSPLCPRVSSNPTASTCNQAQPQSPLAHRRPWYDLPPGLPGQMCPARVSLQVPRAAPVLPLLPALPRFLSAWGQSPSLTPLHVVDPAVHPTPPLCFTIYAPIMSTCLYFPDWPGHFLPCVPFCSTFPPTAP